MRRFLRHPSTMPVQLVLRKRPWLDAQRLNDVSLGGVACHCVKRFRRGTQVQMRVPLLGQQAQCNGVVAWCRKQADNYLVGIAFLDEDTLFRARMVEQLCQIEVYRREREQEMGCSLSMEVVAAEWISTHAEAYSRASLM
ncbi:MAG: PilZ domain-containing protein [Gammaproteobacteria bacterium]|nr:PilZ domain-containing protein [Gammaproteobacteria bacterium]MBU1489793.1 PilZ domain-containing protein [Gammaproteobacteria bacterium]MBU2067712.1 PilZ domain-containing protein [Gammaproteobacteria bacterium]MBU2140895.1 PilZ domain-containing protein [Gammaproteobacteria bacterium]MBU2218433.1 PilZ domain-containing protein [Gammaproteobacteria bacterium]